MPYVKTCSRGTGTATLQNSGISYGNCAPKGRSGFPESLAAMLTAAASPPGETGILQSCYRLLTTRVHFRTTIRRLASPEVGGVAPKPAHTNLVRKPFVNLRRLQNATMVQSHSHSSRTARFG